MFFCYTHLELLCDISLKEKLSHLKLKQLTNEVINRLKDWHKNDNSEKHGFCEYMINKKWIENEEDDEMYLKMTSETIDILEGKDCRMVIDQCLAAGVNFIIESLKDSFCGNEGVQFSRECHFVICIYLFIYICYMLYMLFIFKCS